MNSELSHGKLIVYYSQLHNERILFQAAKERGGGDDGNVKGLLL